LTEQFSIRSRLKRSAADPAAWPDAERPYGHPAPDWERALHL